MNKLFYINPKDHSIDEIKKIILQNPQIEFLSLQSVDLGNNTTDEKIPVNSVIGDFHSFIKTGIQTDGSSVILPLIADINNARVDMIPDTNVKWIVDYNYANINETLNLPVGTLIIPAFLLHDNKFVCSRSVLKNSNIVLENTLKSIINNDKNLYDYLELDSPIKNVDVTLATELEFWVNSPDNRADEEKLSTSQLLKEQYWKRTIGSVRTALEETLTTLDKYGFFPEMGHKEVGGVQSKLKSSNNFTKIMEQIEIDWKYDISFQSADNEIFSKDIVYDIFTRHGLDVTFKAKPIEGVAGSGEHHHIGIILTLENDKKVNLFSPKIMEKSFINKFGYAALFGILKNYEALNPFITSTSDSFNRLKPGFEAPVCIVSSLGHTPEVPTRNRTVLIGLVRDISNKYATRFEIRSPNPTTNTYLTVAAIVQAMIDAINVTIVKNDMSDEELYDELNKKYGESAVYLDTNREYRSELDVFEEYDDETRYKLFGNPPRTVWENILQFKDKNNIEFLVKDNIFTKEIINSYFAGITSQWLTELEERIIPANIKLLRTIIPLHENDDLNEVDSANWIKIFDIKTYLMKDTLTKKSLFNKLSEAIEFKDYDKVSNYQIKIIEEIAKIKEMYRLYKRNIINLIG